MKRQHLYIMFFFISCILVGCGGTAGGQAAGNQPGDQTPATKAPGSPTPVKVILDVYSGRPNPTWELSAQDAVELSQLLARLTTVAQDPGDGGLGYRGFLIDNPGQTGGIAAHTHVFQGVVTITDNGHKTSYQDTQNIEKWLENQARNHGQGEILKSLGK